MGWPALEKSVHDVARANLDDYDRVCATFSWADARRHLDGLPDGRGLNIAHEAVDRHVARLGTGRTRGLRPRSAATVGQDGMLAVRDVVVATLAADHRASDGHRGGRYLSLVDELLHKPEEL